MFDHGFRMSSFCKKRQQQTLASCVDIFLSFSVESRPWYHWCCVFARGFSISSLLATVGCISSLSICWWSSTYCLICLSHSVSFIVARDSASPSPSTLHCILGTLKPPCSDLTKGDVGVAGWQWTYSLWCRHISLLLQLAFSTPSPSSVGCCISEMLVPWNELTAIVDDVLWSILSTTAVVNTFVFRLGGHTVSVSCALSYDEHSTLSYEIDKPSECYLSIRSLWRAFKWNITPMYTGNGVSWLWTCPVHSSVLQVCLTLLNLRSWANVIAAWLGFIVDWHLVFAPSRIMFNNDSKVWGIDTL